MTTGGERFARAIARIDAANALDPNREQAEGCARPKELLYAERLTAMLARFDPEASETLKVAARCQHVERWTIPRTDYPLTRVGYERWRTHLRDFHAERAGAMLREAGYDAATIARVGALIRKERLKADPEAQALEDVVALVFMESYLDDFVARHATYDEAKLLDILRKTARKMSARGRGFALTSIAPPAALLPVLRKALGSGATPPEAPRTPGETPG
jgi:hypothetical protein